VLAVDSVYWACCGVLQPLLLLVLAELCAPNDIGVLGVQNANLHSVQNVVKEKNKKRIFIFLFRPKLAVF